MENSRVIQDFNPAVVLEPAPVLEQVQQTAV
jgi:hypothetical protein